MPHRCPLILSIQCLASYIFAQRKIVLFPEWLCEEEMGDLSNRLWHLLTVMLDSCFPMENPSVFPSFGKRGMVSTVWWGWCETKLDEPCGASGTRLARTGAPHWLCFFCICPEDSKARAGPQAQEPVFPCDSPWMRRDPSRRASSPWQRAHPPSPAPGPASALQSGFLPWVEQQTRLVPNPEHAKANLWAATPCFLLNTWRRPSSGQNCF